MGIEWNHLLNGKHAMALIVMACGLEAHFLQLPVLPGWLAVHPTLPDRSGYH
jgi:hypothetical protein